MAERPLLHTEDPAVAVAMARCLAARVIDAPTTSHPRACGWEDWPTAELDIAVREFNDWAGFDDRANSTARHATRRFAELPAAQREALIVAAQAFEPEPFASSPGPNGGDVEVEADRPDSRRDCSISLPAADEPPAEPEEVMPWAL